ncbi:MAG TPA: PIG-L family deacetylase [Thermoanaerobaculia bacterium]|nr:PIG-L family deacetylase [Thermoanaerobaculia bacterium]
MHKPQAFWLILLALFTVRLSAQELVCTPIADAQNGSAYPVRPTDCGSYTGPFNQPAIFFAAHPDDETLGMAGSISQALAAGRTVVVELMTRGTASNALGTLCTEPTSGTIAHSIVCDSTHLENITHPAPSPSTILGCGDTNGFGNARAREFMDSMRRLGVQAIAIHDYQDGALASAKVADRARFWIGLGIPGTTLFGTSGTLDYQNHPDHIAVHDGIASTGFAPRTFLSIYAGAICDASTRRAQAWQRTVPLATADCNAKKNALASYRVWNDAAGRYAVGWFHSTGNLFESEGATGFNEDCNEYVTDEVTAPGGGSTGNPFVYVSPRHQFLACYGIAGRISSNCDDITDLNDQKMCYALSTSSQTPCTTMTDRNLQLACYGMAFAPNYPSNCRDVTDAQMRSFCYGVSSWGSMPDCNNVTDASTRALCYGMSLRNGSYCASITSSNDRQFCYGVSTHTNSYCATITSCPDVSQQVACNNQGRSWDWTLCVCH